MRMRPPALTISPSLEEFRPLAQAGNLIPVWAELPADMETPLSAFLRLAPRRYGFLLESVEGGEKWARYSFLGADPLLVYQFKGRSATLWQRGKARRWTLPEDPMEGLRDLMSRYRPVRVPGLPRFVGGAVGYLGYDTVRFFDRLPDRSRDDLGLPDGVFLLTDTMLAFDNLRHRLLVLSNAHVESARQADRGYREAVRKIHALLAKLARPLRGACPMRLGTEGLAAQGEEGFRSTLDQAEFMERVRRAKEYIAAGDAIQVVLARRLESRLRAHPFEIYRALRTVNPSPYLFYLMLGDVTVVGSSPEVLVRAEDGVVEVRPIAGTRPRGRTFAEDEALERELRADPKERAEHVMLVDLGRNDVGRVAAVGSVEVTELMTVERYSHVMHLVSNVRGRMAPGADSFDVLRACFPAGTVTGAPKIRAMEIIEELEPTKRGPYAGAVGYFSYSGTLDSCITIRTVVCAQGKAYLEVGAGIVADSDPKTEWLETGSKAKGLILALRMAEASARSRR